jgi:hypothetical protein
MLQGEKRRAAVVSGAAGQAASTNAATNPSTNTAAGALAEAAVVTEAETPALLKEVYKRSDISKPRNLVGMAKDIPETEMKALLLANIAVTSDVMNELALQRGIAVKDYLASKQLPVERLFLGAAKPAGTDAKWTPRAELNLATN